MKRKGLYVILVALIFSAALATNGSADAKLYLCPPGSAYFSSLNTGDSFTLKIIAEADLPGVTMFVFKVTWTPENSVEFIHPVDGGSSSLSMTGFFPQSSSDFSRLSGVMPDSTSQEAVGTPGATPEIAVFTAPALNHTGPDSLAAITFRKLSTSYPSFILTNAKAYDSGSNEVSVSYESSYFNIDLGEGKMNGFMLSQATSVVVNIAGNDYQADVTGDKWTLDIRAVSPNLDAAQPITVKAMQGGSLLNSFATTDFFKSAGWYKSLAEHSERPGDSDGDADTDSADLMILRRAYYSSVGDARYDFRSDYNADGNVDLKDFLIFGLNFNG